MESPHEARVLFLREFARHLITNYPQLTETAPKAYEEAPASMTPSLQGSFIEEKNEHDIVGPHMIVAIREIDDIPLQQIQPQHRQPPRAQQETKPTKQPGTQVEQWMADPLIENIECSGPNEPLIMKKKGSLVKTAQQLTDAEIKKIIEELSERSGTALEGGILKAEGPAWSAIAVLSEFGGSRFLIQKRKA